MRSLDQSWAEAHASFSAYPRRRFLSPIFHAQFECIFPLLWETARGAVLDIGSGRSPFRDILTPRVASFDTLDIDDRIPGLTYQLDIHNLAGVPEASYDTALCIDVLEHTHHPARALAEIHRILRPGGTVVVSVPHLSRLHDEPNDYYRFTAFGLRVLLEEAGFALTQCETIGGLATFLGHQVATWVVASAWPLGWVGRTTPYLCTVMVTWPCRAIDRLTDRHGRFATEIVAIGSRRR